MARARVFSVLGLGFGDCGKGLFTDALARRLDGHTVVRFNGGPQAGHTVALPDGRVHVFAQIGAGSFVPGLRTLLARPVVVDPLALAVEAARLAASGVEDALAGLDVDAGCRVLTPFHAALGRLRERARGAEAHGTTGLGIGEAVRESLQRPEEVLRFGDLGERRQSLGKLEALRARCLEAAAALGGGPGGEGDASLLADMRLAERWWEAAAPFARLARPGVEVLGAALARSGAVLFEGAQGMLLDEHHGFHPHTTWSSPHPREVEALVVEAGGATELRHLGVLRSYLTRHGAGPLPTEDAALDALPELTNRNDGWQGRFRRGHPDGVLLDYACRGAEPLDGLLVSHLDAFGAGPPPRWCEAYDLPGEAGGLERVSRLDAPPPEDLEARACLTERLHRAVPRYAPGSLAGPATLVERLEAVSGIRVRFASRGPTHAHVEALAGLES